jgi:tetratricopeptide (TPR) repeat protein
MMKQILIIFLSIFIIGSLSLSIEAKSNEEIYQEKLAQLASDDVKGHYQLGIWCEQNKLPEQAQTQFKKVIELDPEHADARKKLGHAKYEGKWMTPDEMMAKGLVKYKDKWMTYEEMMKAKGMVQFEEQWVTPSEKKRLETMAKKIDALAKRFPPQGVLDKPGADNENLPWEQARVKETDHFVVKTNLSEDALNDICFLLECAYLTWQDFLGFSESKTKLKVLVTKNRGEYEQIYQELFGSNPGQGMLGRFSPKERKGNNEDFLMTFHNPEQGSTKPMLLHEGTHYAVHLIVRAISLNSLIWFDEGLATYFESSKLEDKKLIINLINQNKISSIKDTITKNTYIKLKDFINLSGEEFGQRPDICYPQAWSLMYFLINGQEGKYKQCFQAYLEAWEQKKIVVNKDANLKIFEKCMSVSIDQLEKEWKEYTLKLK